MDRYRASALAAEPLRPSQSFVIRDPPGHESRPIAFDEPVVVASGIITIRYSDGGGGIPTPAPPDDMGGGGGGRPELAQAGGKQPEKVNEALQGVPALVRQGLS